MRDGLAPCINRGIVTTLNDAKSSDELFGFGDLLCNLFRNIWKSNQNETWCSSQQAPSQPLWQDSLPVKEWICLTIIKSEED